MPRPCKRRRICALPGCGRFGPKETSAAQPSITMTLDEFETIRLIDLENLTQEQCAAQMDVARTTVQAIYNRARVKLAQCLVNQQELFIQGGDYVLCDGSAQCCGCGRCRHHSCTTKNTENKHAQTHTGGFSMKIAVTYENGQIFQHFGHTEQFKLYDVGNGKVTASTLVNTNGSGHGALAGFLKSAGVTVLICGGIGGGAQQALSEAGIQLYGGVSGEADAAVENLLTGSLQFNPNVQCNHHGEHHTEGSCGEHGCGEHHCSES